MEQQEPASESPPDVSNIERTLCPGPLPPPYSTLEYELQTANMEQQAAADDTNIGSIVYTDLLHPPSYSELQQSTPVTTSSLPLRSDQPPPAYHTLQVVDCHASPLPQQPDQHQQQQQVVLSVPRYPIWLVLEFNRRRFRPRLIFLLFYVGDSYCHYR